ncbi:uncharacterized protein LOC112873105 [Panicum hallii]|jgi:hypothetical protein|uniref:uncharacterized protein LOC112873105 n=1 Tax=Panicum hallii TaxID=206008 RepID=UPI000DF4D3F7|nr:uncharacterized protein LOC112873105 [Panicum hallii]
MGATISRRRSPQLLPPPPPPPPSESLASLPENVLAEIFIKLPPHPASLRSVSLGSHQFRDVVTNRPFLRKFHAHHGDVPPLVGLFLNEKIPHFLPTTCCGVVRSKSDSAVAGSGPLEPCDAGWYILSTRHGRVLLQSPDRRRLLVLDPMVGRRQYMDAPLRYRPKYRSTAAVVCDPGTAGHGYCRSTGFRIVFVYFSNIFQTLVCIYSSETGRWVKVDLFQDMAPRAPIDVMRPCVQVGDVIYWQCVFPVILAFNVNTHQLSQVPVPAG